MSSVKDLLRGDVVDGSGTANYVSKWSDADTITNSVIYDDGTNVGIGTNSPSAKLHIAVASAAVNGTKGVRITNTLGTTAVFECGSSNDSFIGTESVSDFSIRTANSERMRIASNGFVGVGTSSPVRLLNLYDASTPVFAMHNSTTTVADTRGFLIYVNSDDAFIQNKEQNGVLGFITGGNTERMRIMPSGQVLIGTSTNFVVRALSLQSTSAHFRSVDYYNGVPSLVLSSDIDTNGGLYLEVLTSGGGRIGSITRATTSSIAFNTTGSDLRLKKNIEDWNESVLDSFATIEPKEFHFNEQEDSEEKTKGFIAQEMVDKFPEAYPVDVDGYYNYNPSGMVIYLTKAIQELKAEIETLKAQINN